MKEFLEMSDADLKKVAETYKEIADKGLIVASIDQLGGLDIDIDNDAREDMSKVLKGSSEEVNSILRVISFVYDSKSRDLVSTFKSTFFEDDYEDDEKRIDIDKKVKIIEDVISDSKFLDDLKFKAHTSSKQLSGIEWEISEIEKASEYKFHSKLRVIRINISTNTSQRGMGLSIFGKGSEETPITFTISELKRFSKDISKIIETFEKNDD